MAAALGARLSLKELHHTEEEEWLVIAGEETGEETVKSS